MMLKFQKTQTEVNQLAAAELDDQNIFALYWPKSVVIKKIYRGRLR